LVYPVFGNGCGFWQPVLSLGLPLLGVIPRGTPWGIFLPFGCGVKILGRVSPVKIIKWARGMIPWRACFMRKSAFPE